MNNYYKHILYKVFFYILFGIVIFSLSHIFYGFDSVNALTNYNETLNPPAGFTEIPSRFPCYTGANVSDYGFQFFNSYNETTLNNPYGYSISNSCVGSNCSFFGGIYNQLCKLTDEPVSSSSTYLTNTNVNGSILSFAYKGFSINNLTGVKTIFTSMFSESKMFHNGYYAYYTDNTGKKYKCDINNSVTYYDSSTEKFQYGASVFCNVNFDDPNIYTNGYFYLHLLGLNISNSFETYGFPISDFFYINDSSGEYAPLYSSAEVSSDEYSDILNTLSDNQNKTNQLLEDSSVSGAITDSNSLVGNDNFNKNYGLQDIVNAPITLINRLSSTCSPINLTIPYFNANVSIPCMSTVYPKIIGSAGVNTISIVINGIFAYRMLLVLFHFVNKTQKSDNDEVEVIKL